MLQGTLKILMLVVVACGIATGEPAGWPVGAWSAALAALYVTSLWMVASYEHEPTWTPATSLPEISTVFEAIRLREYGRCTSRGAVSAASHGDGRWALRRQGVV